MSVIPTNMETGVYVYKDWKLSLQMRMIMVISWKYCEFHETDLYLTVTNDNYLKDLCNIYRLHWYTDAFYKLNIESSTPESFGPFHVYHLVRGLICKKRHFTVFQLFNGRFGSQTTKCQSNPPVPIPGDVSSAVLALDLLSPNSKCIRVMIGVGGMMTWVEAGIMIRVSQASWSPVLCWGALWWDGRSLVMMVWKVWWQGY